MNKEKKTLEILSDIESIIQSCPRNNMDAIELRRKDIKAINSKTMDLINNLIKDIRGYDAKQIRGYISRQIIK